MKNRIKKIIKKKEKERNIKFIHLDGLPVMAVDLDDGYIFKPCAYYRNGEVLPVVDKTDSVVVEMFGGEDDRFKVIFVGETTVSKVPGLGEWIKRAKENPLYRNALVRPERN